MNEIAEDESKNIYMKIFYDVDNLNGHTVVEKWFIHFLKDCDGQERKKMIDSSLVMKRYPYVELIFSATVTLCAFFIRLIL